MTDQNNPLNTLDSLEHNGKTYQFYNISRLKEHYPIQKLPRVIA